MGNESIAVNGLLALYCSWNNVKRVRELLKVRANDIDLIDDNNGGVFTLIISRNYTDILAILIEFYEKQKLQGDPKSTDYRIAYKNLQDTIEAALEQSSEPSEEVNEIISKYLPTEAVYSESMEQTGRDNTHTENDISHSHSSDNLKVTENLEEEDNDDYLDRTYKAQQQSNGPQGHQEEEEEDNANKYLSLTGPNLSMLGYDPIIAHPTGNFVEYMRPYSPILETIDIGPIRISGLKPHFIPPDFSSKNYKYWQLNLLSEKALHDGELGLCRKSIDKAMSLVCQNPSEANPEYKARVLYNYMKLTHKPLDFVIHAMKNKEFLYKEIIPQIQRMSEDEGESDISYQFNKLTISKTKPFIGYEPNNIFSEERKGNIEHKLIEEYNDSSNHACLIGDTTNSPHESES